MTTFNLTAAQAAEAQRTGILFVEGVRGFPHGKFCILCISGEHVVPPVEPGAQITVTVPCCDRCGHSGDWHTLRDLQNVGPLDPEARFSCYGHPPGSRPPSDPRHDECDCRDYVDGTVPAFTATVKKVLPVVSYMRWRVHVPCVALAPNGAWLMVTSTSDDGAERADITVWPNVIPDEWYALVLDNMEDA